MEREKLGSRMGFILLSAGCAIGIGNVWRFPYITGLYGGGVFVLFYLFFLITMGIPVMTMEFAVGRASRKSIIKSYTALEKPGQKWHLHGYLGMAGNYLLMMFYTTVAGWMLYYFYQMLTKIYGQRRSAGGRYVSGDARQPRCAYYGDGHYCCGGNFDLFYGASERRGADYEDYDEPAACDYYYSCGTQSDAGGRHGRTEVLSASGFREDGGSRNMGNDNGRYESGIFYFEPWNRCDGNFRQLY